MTDAALAHLAERAGIECTWRDVFGETHHVGADPLRAVLAALDLPAGSDAQIADSFRALEADADTTLPPLIVAEQNCPIPVPAGRFRLALEDGGTIDGVAEGALPPVPAPGYHTLELNGRVATLAVAPPRCFGLQDAAPGHRLWGLAVQLYALRRDGDGGLGDFPALAAFARTAARHGASAVAISPAHAQFSADPDRFAPYAPSSRAMLNVLHADPGKLLATPAETAALVDWPLAARTRLAALRDVFAAASADPTEQARLAAFRQQAGDVLETHARFEVLHAHFFGTDRTRWHWRDWPEPYRDPASPEVAAFAAKHPAEIAFHAWMQMRAADGLQAVQDSCRAAGMPVGLIADLAVGADSGGSHCWARQAETLTGLTIGAPPDLLGPLGQNWGLVAFSPRGLPRNGYTAFLEMLRASLRHAGGVRIDHVMGLQRLWVIPDGAPSATGAYLRFPVDDLLRLVALESWRHRAIVLGEDLGTLPHGFHERLQRAGIMGLRVLWFERDGNGFRAPASWTSDAAAMTSTHDLPTVAGWWQGHDIALREKLGLSPDPAADRATRAADRTRLWQTFRASGAAQHDEPPPERGGDAAGSAAMHIGRTACRLALLPTEDALALPDQPNLPGTLDEYPNWRRRLPGCADTMLDDPVVAGRLAALDAARRE